MENAIEKVIDKISTYEILNRIIQGTIYIVLTEKLTRFSLQDENLLTKIVICYLAGLVIGRIGSLVIEPILCHKTKKGKAIAHFVPYNEYVEAEKLDETRHIKEFLAINNMYRSLITTMLALLFTIIISYIWDCAIVNHIAWVIPFIIILLMILFILSYRKQTGYIKKRVEKILKDEHKDKLEEILKN